MSRPCCPHPVERHAYNGCAECGCGMRWLEHPDRDKDRSEAAWITLCHQRDMAHAERDAAVRERDELREQVRVAAKPWADDVRLSARIAKDAETRAQNLAAQIVDEKVEAAQEQVVEAIAAWFESLIRKMPNMYVGDFYTATEVARHIRAGKWRKEQP